MPLIFVYGTLKRDGSNHRQIAGQEFVGLARTVPGYRLFSLGDYPGMVVFPADRAGVTGELWSVTAAAIPQLDEFEGVAQGLYQRLPIALLPPFADRAAETYLYPHSVESRPDLGSIWLV